MHGLFRPYFVDRFRKHSARSLPENGDQKQSERLIWLCFVSCSRQQGMVIRSFKIFVSVYTFLEIKPWHETITQIHNANLIKMRQRESHHPFRTSHECKTKIGTHHRWVPNSGKLRHGDRTASLF